MTVTPLHQRPVWVPVPELGANRFDPLYYDPSLTIAERHFRSKGTLSWRRLKQVADEIFSFGAYELTSQIRFVAPQSGSIPFVTVTEIDNPVVDMARARHIDRASHEILQESQCGPGTLLLSMAGSIGRTGVIPENAGQCNSNQDVAKITVNPDESDPHFLASYFSSRVGIAACEREAAGAVQKHLYLYNISTLPIPDPEKPIRIAIGHKVRAAERLRAEATFSVADAVNRIDGMLGTADFSVLRPNPDGACEYFSSFVPLADLGLFHGAQFYAPKRKHAVSLIKATGIGGRLGSHGHRVRAKGKRKASRGHIDPANVSGSDGYWYSGGSDDGGDVVLAEPGHTLFLRMRPYLNKTTINDTNNVVSGSPEFLVYEFDGLDGYYATLCLRQPWALAQVAEIATGDRPRVDGEFVDEVFVPWPDETVRHGIGQLYQLSFALRRRADRLVQQAIVDVENLIDGKLDEDKCLAEGRELAKEFGLEVP